MAYGKNANPKYFVRGDHYQGFRTIESLLVDPDLHQIKKVPGTVPTSGYIRPSAFGSYPRMDGIYPPEMVITSGSVRMLGGAANGSTGTYIGVLMRDTLAGQEAEWITKGRVKFELDAGDPDGSPTRPASSESLQGKPCYYLPESGTVTDQTVNAAFNPILIGTFLTDREIKPRNLTFGTMFADVDLDQTPLSSAVTITNDSSFTFTHPSPTQLTAFPEATNNDGFVVTLKANAVSGNPNEGIHSIQWAFSAAGGTVTLPANVQAEGPVIARDFGAAGTYQVVLQVYPQLRDGTRDDNGKITSTFSVVVDTDTVEQITA